jgi:hypothetical protein
MQDNNSILDQQFTSKSIENVPYGNTGDYTNLFILPELKDTTNNNQKYSGCLYNAIGELVCSTKTTSSSIVNNAWGITNDGYTVYSDKEYTDAKNQREKPNSCVVQK